MFNTSFIVNGNNIMQSKSSEPEARPKTLDLQGIWLSGYRLSPRSAARGPEDARGRSISPSFGRDLKVTGTA
jgi:hypothetical protein